jgi:predicted dithiol-disulfide oxidoreductase (DUF899 family)
MEESMTETSNAQRPDAAPAMPEVTDRAAWQAQLDELLVREKAHTREGDAIAAARRRLPMVEVDAATPLIGARGAVPLLEVFETYWSSGRAAEAMAPSYGLLDMTVYGRQESWEDSPPGWPQPIVTGLDGAQFRTGGRPTAQWSRLAAGRSDTLY